MRLVLLIISFVVVAPAPVEARGGGKFLSALVSRGGGAAVRSASNGVASTYKSYTPDVLTVEQLAQCIRTATQLDNSSARIDADRAILEVAQSRITESETTMRGAETMLDRTSQRSIDRFNAMVGSHNKLIQAAKDKQSVFNASVVRHNSEIGLYNTSCGKNYYESDLSAAQGLASAN